MAYQEVKRTSYGKNIGNSAKGILTGILMVILGTIFIFWNENRAIKQYNAIDRAEKSCVEMPDVANINSEFEGKMVHCNGIATTNEVLNDNNFGVSVNAISLKRNVEYYQWVERSKTEKKEKVGGATEEITTYYYEKKWVSDPVGNDFKDPEYVGKNFVFKEVPEMDWYADPVKIGAYNLPDFFVNSIGGRENIEVSMDSATIAEWNRAIKTNLGVSEAIDANYVYTEGNTVYFGTSMSDPSIGDVRVTFTYIPNNQEVSLLGKVSGNTFEKYVDKNGNTVSLLMAGNVSAEKMFESLRDGNKTLTWIIRLFLLIVIIAGFRAMISIVPTLLKVLPFLGKGVGAILKFACTILGIVWTFLFIGIAWITVRPALSITLLVVIIALIVWLSIRSKKAPIPQETAETTNI